MGMRALFGHIFLTRHSWVVILEVSILNIVHEISVHCCASGYIGFVTVESLMTTSEPT